MKNIIFLKKFKLIKLSKFALIKADKNFSFAKKIIKVINEIINYKVIDL